jgi:alpha-tubulin suppressor-like RCC1 family protein
VRLDVVRALVVAVIAADVVACGTILSGGPGRTEPDASAPPDVVVTAEAAPPEAGGARDTRRTLALGFLHGCVLMPDGKVRCWGFNGAGELGDGLGYDAGNRLDHALAPQVVPGLDHVTAIAAGLAHTCVVRDDGHVECWGINSYGQLGDGTTERSSKPVRVGVLSDAVSLAGGTSFTCAIQTGKTVTCWGANYSGQLGDGTKSDAPALAPVPVKNLTNVIAITAGTYHTCALVEGGDVFCWGKNDHGQLGLGTNVESLVPAKTPLAKIAQVVATETFTCAREDAGRVFCWGLNDYGQLGTSPAVLKEMIKPFAVGAIDDATFLWAGFEHACALRRSGAVVCWGNNEDGQLGGGTADASVIGPAEVLGLEGRVRAVWTGGSRSCAITEDDHAFCWGINTLGQLGRGTEDSSSRAVPMVGLQ